LFTIFETERSSVVSSKCIDVFVVCARICASQMWASADTGESAYDEEVEEEEEEEDEEDGAKSIEYVEVSVRGGGGPH